MLDIAKSFEAAAPQKPFNNLEVGQRVLFAGPRTIVIDNIAYTELMKGDAKRARRFSAFLFGGIFVLIGLAILQASSIAALVPIALGAYLIWRGLNLSQDYELSIRTNDGSRFVFSGTNIELLNYASEYISWKINAADETSTTVFNFNNSQIVNSQIGDKISN